MGNLVHAFRAGSRGDVPREMKRRVRWDGDLIWDGRCKDAEKFQHPSVLLPLEPHRHTKFSSELPLWLRTATLSRGAALVEECCKENDGSSCIACTAGSGSRDLCFGEMRHTSGHVQLSMQSRKMHS